MERQCSGGQRQEIGQEVGQEVGQETLHQTDAGRRGRFQQQLVALLALLYRPAAAQSLALQLLELAPLPAARPDSGCGDCMLITYADTILAEDQTPLETLGRFLDSHVGSVFGRLHVLPFFPSSSDDGFAVVDYRRVDHRLGSWEEVRPRTTPLVSAVHTYAGIRHVWNTFSDDQIDLDFSNPAVLREFAAILFFYVPQGARLIRLDVSRGETCRRAQGSTRGWQARP